MRRVLLAGLLLCLLFAPVLLAQGTMQFSSHLGHYGLGNHCATIEPLTATSTKATFRYVLKCPERKDTFEGTLEVEAPGTVELLPAVPSQSWLMPTRPFPYYVTLSTFKYTYDNSSMVPNYTGEWKLVAWVSVPGHDSKCTNTVTGSYNTNTNTISGSGRGASCLVDSLDPSNQSSVTAGVAFTGPGLFGSGGSMTFNSFISVRTFYRASTTPVIFDIKPSVAMNDPAAEYAKKGAAKPLLATITGANFPASPKVSLGDGIQADVVSATGAQIEVKLSGFGDLPEGPRSVTISGSSATVPGGKDLFFVSSIRLAKGKLEVNQGVPMECTKARPCVAMHPTVIRARLICAGEKTDKRPCEVDKSTPKDRTPGKSPIPPPFSTGILRILRDGKEVAASPIEPISRMNILPAGAPPDESLRILIKGMGRDSLDFYLSDLTSRLDLSEGKYEFAVEIDPRKPGRPPVNSKLDPNRNLVFRLPDQYFLASNVPARHDTVTGARGRLYLGVITNHNVDATNNITAATVHDYARFLRALYPLSYEYVKVRVLNPVIVPQFAVTTSDAEEDAARDGLEKTLNMLRAAGGTYTHLILLTDKITSAGLGNCRKENGEMRCRGRTILVNQNPVRANGPQTSVNVYGTIAHELGHNLGFGDTYIDPNANNVVDSVNPVSRGCQINPVAGTIGCVAEEGNLDTYLRATALRTSNYTNVAAATQFEKYDFMGNSAWSERWTDLRSWNYLYSKFNDPSAPGVSLKKAAASDPGPGAGATDLIGILVGVQPDGSGSILQCNRWTGSLDAPADEAGQYALSILDGAGNVVASQKFDVPASPRRSTINHTLPFPGGAARIVLSNGGKTIATRIVSPNPPFVELTAPAGAGPFEDKVRVAWNASDLDGDPLTYSLFYSPDDGESWLPVALRLETTNYEWDTSTAPGARSGRLKVIANDGVHDSGSMSKVALAVTAKPPEIAIVSPEEGSTLDVTAPVIFQAAVHDSQEGALTADQVAWTSDRDGALGSGFGLANPALTAGVHVITATSTNSGGLRSAASVTITVPPSPIAPAIDSIAPSSASPGATVTIDGSNFDPEAEFNTVLAGGVKAQVTAASASRLTVVLPSQLPGGAIAVTVSANGLTSAPYTLTIVGGSASATAKVEASQGSLDFGAVTPGSSKDLELTLKNSGTATATIGSIASSNARFTVPAGATAIPAGGSVTILVRFAPADRSAQTGQLTISGNAPAITVALKGSGGDMGGSGGGGGYTLARIEVNRTYPDSSWKPLVLLPDRQTVGSAERRFQMGWEFLWPAPSNDHRNRANALVTLTAAPSSVTPGATSSLAASMVGDWYTSSGYGVERDHTISLEGAGGSGRWSTVGDPNGTYHGTFDTSNTSAAVPQPNSAGEVVLTLNATLRFGGDHSIGMEIRLVYATGGSGPASCTYSLSPPSATAAASAGTGGVSVAASASTCQWGAAVSTAPWIVITSGYSYSGSSTVRYQVAANTGTASRSGTLTIAGETFTVTQSAAGGGGGGGGAACFYSLTPSSAGVGAAATSGTVSVATSPNCGWTATSDVSWVTIASGGTGNGPGTVSYSVAANTGTSGRTGSLTIAGQTFNITQGGAAAGSYTLARIEVNRTYPSSDWKQLVILPDRQTVGAAERRFQMGWEFLWPAPSNDHRNRASAMVTLASVPPSVSPGGTATLAAGMVGDWYTSSGYGVERDHTISLEGAAGSGRWSTNGDPNGTYHGTFDARNATAAVPQPNSSGEIALVIAATLRFGGDHSIGMEIRLVYTGSGSGPAPCTYSLSPPNATAAASAGTSSVAVSASASTCQWGAAVSTAPWIVITSGYSYAGTSTVAYQVAANTGPGSRSGALTIAGETFTVTQTAAGGGGGSGGGSACTYSISPSSVQAPATGSIASFSVSAPAGCLWTAISNASWISMNFAAAGSGNGAVTYSVMPNTGAARTGTITVGGQTFTVNQAAGQGGSGCTFTLSMTSVPVPAVSSATTIDIRASSSACAWTASSNTSWIVLTSAASGTGNGTIAFSVPANPSASVRTGTLTVAGITVTVTQAAGSSNVGQTEQTLQIDNGNFTGASGIPQGQTGVWFVNRLTPTAYPAEMKSVLIYFGDRSDGLPPNTPITLVMSTNPSGGSSFGGLVFYQIPGRVTARGSFIEFPMPSATIYSGDFIVGFIADNPRDGLPGDLDSATSQGRSYASVNGSTFTSLSSMGIPGNLAIRAKVSINK